MIRILHVVGGMNCGGTENFIMNVYRQIDRSKIQFDFLVHSDKECYFDDEIRHLGGRIYHIKRYNIKNYFSYRDQLITFFKQHPGFKAVHGHVGSTACIYLKIAKSFGIYTIAHSHALNDRKLSLKKYLYEFHAFIARGIPDYYMACSYEAGVERYGRKISNSGRFAIVNNGIGVNKYIYDPIKRDEIRQQLNLTDKFVVGHIGRLHPVKNHEFMMKVLVELKKLGNDYYMLFVGDGELRDDLENQSKKLNLEDSLLFTGIRKNIPELLQAFDYFIFPSINEGLGIGLIEAQAAGLQCIANADGIMPLAKISDLVCFMPVSDGAAQWAKHIHNNRDEAHKRRDMSNIVKHSGFDIAETANSLQKFYLNI